ncbi:hypothetical protein PM082_003474 [Marasmius tenuissimus]|nr:hypothetical protein PM082_003474 [Marasmius tenuissimus]
MKRSWGLESDFRRAVHPDERGTEGTNVLRGLRVVGASTEECFSECVSYDWTKRESEMQLAGEPLERVGGPEIGWAE